MLIYTFVAIIILFGIFQFDLRCKKTISDKVLYWTICFILICVAGFRYRVGGDTLSYFDNYLKWPTINELLAIDLTDLTYQPLWYLLAAICKLISPEFYVLQLLQASIVCIISFWFIKKYTDFKYIAILLWYYGVYFYFTMEVMRESIAVSVWLLVIDSMLHKQYRRYYMYSILAFLMHLSAAILFIMPFLYSLVERKIKTITVAYLLLFILFNVINIDFVSALLPEKMSSKFLAYQSLGVYWPTFVKSALHAFAIYLVIQIYFKTYSDRICFLPFLKIEMLILFSTGMFYMTERFVNYFLLIEIVILAQSFHVFFVKRYQYDKIKLFISILLIFVLKTYYYGIDQSHLSYGTRFYNRIVPYETIFDPKSHPWRENIYYNSVYNMQQRSN